MVESKELKFLEEKSRDTLFKSVIKLSKLLSEDIDSSTFMTVEDALNTGSSITIFKNLPEDKSTVLRNFVLK